jgi:hypothetical protein
LIKIFIIIVSLHFWSCADKIQTSTIEVVAENKSQIENIDLTQDTQEIYNLANSEFYDKIYPIWRDDSLKVIVISGLLEKYSKTAWRRTMFQYLVYSLDKLGRNDEIITTLQNWCDESLHDYFPFYNSAIYLEGINFNLALQNAKIAYSMLSNIQKPLFYPEEEWQLERQSAKVKVATIYGKLLIKDNQQHRGEMILNNAIDDNLLSIDDETTTARCWTELAKLRNQQYNFYDVKRFAINAIIEGDSRNKYTPVADSLLRDVTKMQEVTHQDIVEFCRDFTDYNDVKFTDVTKEMGFADISGSRIAWGDYNNDGFQDILLNGNRLFKNERGEKFTDVTSIQFPDTLRGNGGIWGDFNNDGRLDIVTKDPESIWINNGKTYSKTVGNNSISDNKIPTEGLGIGDVNRDGYLDIYFANYEINYETQSDQLFYGLEGGYFIDVTDSVGVIPQNNRAGRGVNMGDFDNDKDLDIFVSNYRLKENFLWLNNGDGGFTNQALDFGIAGIEVGDWWGHTIGSEWADYDNDGDLDLLTANLAHPRYIDFSNRTMLYKNSGAPNWDFVDVRKESGIQYEETNSEPAWGDLNNDGWLDLYITNIYEGRRSFLYMSNGDETFREVTYLSGTRHFNGWGVAFADYDEDGDLDIFVAGGKVQLFRNELINEHLDLTGNNSNWLAVQIKTTKHSDAIGTRIRLFNDEISLIREIQGGKGTTNQHSLVQHFGLGNHQPPFSLEVTLPNGTHHIYKIDRINQLIHL